MIQQTQADLTAYNQQRAGHIKQAIDLLAKVSKQRQQIACGDASVEVCGDAHSCVRVLPSSCVHMRSVYQRCLHERRPSPPGVMHPDDHRISHHTIRPMTLSLQTHLHACVHSSAHPSLSMHISLSRISSQPSWPTDAESRNSVLKLRPSAHIRHCTHLEMCTDPV